MPQQYKVLNKQVFTSGNYSLLPIRSKDRFKIMKWRNEQMYHLRQRKVLTEQDQDRYFNEVVAKLFIQDQPNQLLFSFLENGNCIGYGGLVHINWIDRNAEISFIMDTVLEEDRFKKYWLLFVGILEKVAFEEINLHKIYTYAFDLRPQLYDIFESINYVKEAHFREHYLFDGRYIDVIIHSKINPELL